MMKEKIIFVFAILLISSTAFALEEASKLDTQWQGEVFVEFDKNSFEADEEITGVLRIRNDEEIPLVGGKIVMHITTGEFSYPSQYNNESNIVHEETIDDIWVLPRFNKPIPFTLPPQSGGKYRLDVYMWIAKSPFDHSSSSIFKVPSRFEFTVEGEERQRAEIFRELTSIEGFVGPIGFPAKPLEEIKGVVLIKNYSEQEKSGMKLKVSICEWASVFCDSPEEKIFDVPTIVSGSEMAVPINLTTPELPSAYAINLVLESDEGTESIYKSRVIVEGGTSKIRKIFFEGLDDKDYSLTVLFAGSPDHFNYPDFNNFSIEAEIFNKGASLEKHVTDVQSISTGETLAETFDIEAKMFDRICSRIIKEETVYEEECFPVELEAIQEAYDLLHPEEPNVEYNYNEDLKSLEFTVSKESADLDVRVFIVSTDKTFYEESFSGGKEFSDKLVLEKDNYTMVVDDFVLAKQFQYDLFFNLEKADLEDPVIGDVPQDSQPPVLCEGEICVGNTVCSSEVYESADGACCPSSCIPSTSVTGQEALILPLITWVAIILAVIAAFFATKAVGRMKK